MLPGDLINLVSQVGQFLEVGGLVLRFGASINVFLECAKGLVLDFIANSSHYSVTNPLSN